MQRQGQLTPAADPAQPCWDHTAEESCRPALPCSKTLQKPMQAYYLHCSPDERKQGSGGKPQLLFQPGLPQLGQCGASLLPILPSPTGHTAEVNCCLPLPRSKIEEPPVRPASTAHLMSVNRAVEATTAASPASPCPSWASVMPA